MTYIPVNKANTNHKSRDENGREIARYSRYETGIVAGKNREVLAVIADKAGFDGMGFDASIGSGDDSWHVANVFTSDRRYIDTMVIGGAFDSLHAKQVADSQLHRLRGDNCVIVTNPQFDSLSDDKPDTWSIDAINKLLANPSQNKNFLPVITAQELNVEAARVTFDAVQWDSMAGLVSHNGSDTALFLDLIRADGHKQLLEPLNLVRELELLGAEEHSFDALMDTKNRLSLMKDRLFNAMSRNGDAELSVTNVTETKPFKRQGVTNIAFVFELSDGQKLSIWFHNPDSTPSQLKADDVMISWKWMLNKRDVTAVLSPKQGDNVQIPVLAARIMRVARKNSKKFAATQARAAELEKELQDAQTLVEVKQGAIDQLDTDISGLNAAIDAAMAKKAEEPTTPPEATAKEQKEQRERERVLAMQFEEVTQFYKNNGAEPNRYANDIIEKMLAKRLEAIRANPEFVEYLAPYDTYNLLNDEPAPDVLSNSANNEVPPFSVGDPVVWRNDGGEMKGIYKSYNATNHSIAIDTDDGQMNAPANEVSIDHNSEAVAPQIGNFKVGDPVVWRNEIGEMKGTFRGMVGQNIFIMTDDGQMGAPATEVFADDSAPKAAPASGKSDIDAMITKAALEDFEDYSFWIATATVADVKALTEKQFYKLSAALEDVNMHGDHLYLAAMRTGNAEWIAEAKSINDANKTGLTPELSDRRSALWALINGEAVPADDVIPEKLNQVEALFELSKLAPKSGEAIKSDDPDAIEKLEAKLAYHQARAAMMRDANNHLRRGDDEALYAMGFKEKTIASLKEPDFAGRTGFADYQMSNNNGEIGRIKKRLKSLYSERDANTPKPVVAPVADAEPVSYPPVEYDAALDDYIAFKDASKKDRWYARHDNRNGEWTVRVDDEYTRGFGGEQIVTVSNVELLIQQFPAFEGLIELINANAQARERAKVEAEQNKPAADNEFELNASDLKAYQKGVENHSSSTTDSNLAQIAEAKAVLDAAGTTYLDESEYQARINSGDMAGVSQSKQQERLKSYQDDVMGLRDKTVKPSKIVGTGYKDGRSVAFSWLADRITELKASLNSTPAGFEDSTNLRNYAGYLSRLLKDIDNDEPVNDDARAQTMATINEFAKTHEGFNGFIGDNDEAETAVAGKPAGEWAVKIDDDQSVTVFMSLGNGQYTGAYNLTIDLAYNDIFKKTADAAARFGTVDELAGVAGKPAGKEDLDDLFTTRMNGTGAASKRVLKGKTNKAKTAKGTSIASEFALVDAKFLIASHNAAGAKNPDYPQDLQPRDRGRESSIAWVQKTSKALDPESLGRTSRVDTGAPIVGDDLIVESGNGRTIAIKMAYKNGDAEAYRQWLIENARMFGFTEQQVESYKQPVLVRMRTTEVNRAEFAVEANQDDKLSFTASERAKADSKRITGGMLELFTPAANGDINAPANRPFVKQFLASLGATEAAQYTDSNGYPTQALITRIKSAIFSKAYDDDRLLEMMADQTKPDLQNMLNALTMAAPSFVAAQAVNASDAQDLAGQVVDGVEKSINDEVKAAIVDASNMIMSANQNNQDVKEYVLQLGLFDEVDDATAELAVFLAANARSAKKMSEYFNAMAKYIEQDAAKRLTLDIFDDPKPISMADVIAYANKTTNSEVIPPMTQDMFADTDAAPASTDDKADDNSGLSEQLADFESAVNAEGFNPADFDTTAFIELVNATADDAELTARVMAISSVYQQKLVAASMAAMTSLVGGA